VVNPDKIRRAFKERFGAEGRLFSAPGRVNLIGEHTDYNMGFVLPGAIDKAITLELRPNGLKEFRLLALDLAEEETFTVADKSTRHHWASYILGVVMEFQSRCFAVPPFDAVFAGDVPQGGGMSSSAALECAFAFAINELGSFGVQPLELAQIGQSAEHKYAGVRCGIMDQFASLHGKAGHLIRLDCRSLEYELVPFELPHYQLLLIDTRVKHSLASSEYNTRRAECEAGVKALQKKFPHVQSLRDADLAMLESVRSDLKPIIFTRCEYVVEENERVLEAALKLKQGDVAEFGRLMYLSHEGLSEKYNVSCAELDLLVQVARDTPGVLGARMMGGGFGGCTINLVAESAVPEFIQHATERFTNALGHAPLVYPVTIADGARAI
jgi:galactokinase